MFFSRAPQVGLKRSMWRIIISLLTIPGTGKSVLLKAIIRELWKIKPLDSIAVTATTGVASLAISGKTLHSHGGIGHGNEVAEILVKKLNRSRKYRSRWRETQVWIIDEGEHAFCYFDYYSYVAIKFPC